MKEPVGRVYILTNPRMLGLVKIGFTLGTVEGRAKELDATGTPEPFDIAYQIEVRGPETLERKVHGHLSNKRVRNSREFFEIDVVDAILCIRSLASEKFDEECRSEYLEILDETVKRRAEEIELKRYADKVERFEKFDYEAKTLQNNKKQLRRELEELLAKAESGPQLLKLNWFEQRGELPLVLLGMLFLVLFIAAFVLENFILCALAAVFFVASSVGLLKVSSSAQMKNTHNAPIMLLEREIFNLNFDLDQLEKTKMTLPSDLSDFVSVNSVRVTDQGFEPAAKVDSRWM
jgi:hypothetical protein